MTVVVRLGLLVHVFGRLLSPATAGVGPDRCQMI